LQRTKCQSAFSPLSSFASMTAFGAWRPFNDRTP